MTIESSGKQVEGLMRAIEQGDLNTANSLMKELAGINISEPERRAKLPKKFHQVASTCISTPIRLCISWRRLPLLADLFRSECIITQTDKNLALQKILSYTRRELGPEEIHIISILIKNGACVQDVSHISNALYRAFDHGVEIFENLMDVMLDAANNYQKGFLLLALYLKDRNPHPNRAMSASRQFEMNSHREINGHGGHSMNQVTDVELSEEAQRLQIECTNNGDDSNNMEDAKASLCHDHNLKSRIDNLSANLSKKETKSVSTSFATEKEFDFAVTQPYQWDDEVLKYITKIYQAGFDPAHFLNHPLVYSVNVTRLIQAVPHLLQLSPYVDDTIVGPCIQRLAKYFPLINVESLSIPKLVCNILVTLGYNMAVVNNLAKCPPAFNKYFGFTRAEEKPRFLTLQEKCQNLIRRRLTTPNVMLGVEALDLPRQMKRYIMLQNMFDFSKFLTP